MPQESNNSDRTPGPWTPGRSSDKPEHFYFHTGPDRILAWHLTGVFESGSNWPTWADAQVMAASQDLLDALEMLMKEELGDFIYNIRFSERESGEWDGPSWEGPRVTNWGEAVKAAEVAVAKAKGIRND